MSYKIVAVPEEGLLVTCHPEYGEQLWSLCQIRKRQKDPCAICGEPVGREAFRPLTNRGNRYHRLCRRHTDAGI